MLSMQDCLDYCDLNEDEVRVIAHHEHLSFEAAAQLACSLAQDKKGEKQLCDMLGEVVCEAAGKGEMETLQQAERAFCHFTQHHPQSQ
ncbi:hypothetical protein DLREEDagrD3_26900 [Denitratisoma sp. agr-D3]